jgi:transposase
VLAWTASSFCIVICTVEVDAGLIVHHEVASEPNDNRQLYPDGRGNKGYARRFSCAGRGADAGYSSGTAAAACEADGITACVPTKSVDTPSGRR